MSEEWATAPAFDARAVSRHYLQGAMRVAGLTDVSLTIAPGEFVVLAGPSGSGKSTLLNLLGGLDLPDDGTVRVAGTDLLSVGESGRLALRRHRLGFVFQAFNLVPVLSAFENVEYALWLTGMPRSQRRERAEQALADVGLADRHSHRPDHLSGGERQRVALARALANNPLAILADEPTASLDSSTGADIVQLFQRLSRSRGTTLVIATHDPAVVSVAPRVVRLRDGRLDGDEVRC